MEPRIAESEAERNAAKLAGVRSESDETVTVTQTSKDSIVEMAEAAAVVVADPLDPVGSVRSPEPIHRPTFLRLIDDSAKQTNKR